ncbi:GroES-like protein [Trametes maxima]|nr:GroES-like protein [Trametes maxima]
MPSQQTALILESKCGPLVLKKIDVPKPRAGEVLVRIEATALNPADWKVKKYGILIDEYPTCLGFDASGVVEEVGQGVTGYTVNDRVALQACWIPFDGHAFGAFKEYAAVPVGVVAKIPDGLSFEAAATVPSGLAAAAIGLYNEVPGTPSAHLTPPWEDRGRGKFAGKPLFVLGGATSIGQYVIQLARLSGFSPIITTASLHNSDLLKSFGATHVLDRKLPEDELVRQVREIAGGNPEIVYDAVSTSETLAVGYKTTAPGGDLVTVLQEPIPGFDEASKKRVFYVRGFFKSPDNEDLSTILLAKLPSLLETGEIKPNRFELLPGGLRGVAIGLERLENNQVSGAKLVVRPRETE